MNIFAKRSDLPFFTQERITRGFVYASFSRILFAAKHSWMTLRMSRPLLVGSYLQVTWWAFSQWKGRKFASNDNSHCCLLPSCSWVRCVRDRTWKDELNLFNKYKLGVNCIFSVYVVRNFENNVRNLPLYRSNWFPFVNNLISISAIF